MSEIKVAEWISDIKPILFNPTAVQRASLQRLRDVTDGKVDLPDATSPFAWNIESSAINVAAFIEADTLLTRRQYPSSAQTVDDLYLHMSDKDYSDRFATPSHCDFYLMIEERALERAFVPDPITGVSRLVIPRNTEFKIDGYIFSIQYPIEIKRLNLHSYQVTYDTDQASPLTTLTSNVLESGMVSPRRGVSFLRIKIPTDQFWIKSITQPLTAAKLFKKTIPFEDSFYYARVYNKSNQTGSKWKEIRTTHTDQTYDPTIPTAVLKVLPGNLEVFIPQIYFSTGAVTGSVRVDIYQTKGAVNLSMLNYSPDSFSVKFRAVDNSEMTKEVSNLTNISEMFVYSESVINSGTGELSFEELRRRVINNTTGARDLPITNVQWEDSLKSNGFSIVKNVDIVTRRTYLATRDLIPPFDERLITSAATNMQALISTMKELAKHPAVYDNGDRITLTPDLVYRLNNGKLEVVSAATVMAISNAEPDEAAKRVNNEQFVYSPFHYVVDSKDQQSKLRPYYMDAPMADIREFIDNNDSSMLLANTDQYTINKTSFGYRLTVQVKGNEAFKQLADDRIFAQMYFTPHNEVSAAFNNGALVKRTDDGGAVFIFDFNTKFDIEVKDGKHLMAMSSFTMANLTGRLTAADLFQEFRVIFGTYDKINPAWQPHVIDSHIGQFMLPNYGYAITEESFKLKFGVFLKNLWAGARSFPSSQNTLRYDADVPALYGEDVFKVDPESGLIFYLDDNNNVVYHFEHRKGDPILNEDGSPKLAHRKGDEIKDPVTGEPIPISELEVARQLDILVVEGPYYFATDPSSSRYKDSFVSAMVDWIVDDLERIISQGLDQTFIYYYPKANMGNLQVVGENGSLIYVNANQSLKVRLFVKEQVIRNSELRDSLTRDAVRIIDAEFKKNTVAISNIESEQRNAFGEDVFGIEVSGLGGNANYQTLSMLSIGDRLSIKKRLTAQPDGKLIVEEDVTVEFIQHESVVR
jgi:hypothetical protein